MDENKLEEDVEVIEEASEDELEEDVRYVSDDLEEERVDEFVKAWDKLEITADAVSTCFLHLN